MKKIVAIILAAFLMLGFFSVVNPAFAAEKKTITVTEEFYPETREDLAYTAEEKIKRGGKVYALTSVESKITKDNQILVKKTMKSSSKEEVESTMVDDKGNLLTADLKDIVWKESKREPVTVTKDYDALQEIPETLKVTYSVDGKEKEGTAVKTAVANKTKIETVTAPATFYGVLGSTLYSFHGKTVNLQDGNPVWVSYAEDVRDYLGLKGGEITGASWAGDPIPTSGEEFTRTATFTGTQEATYYQATFTEEEKDLTVYEGDILYKGVDPNVTLTAEATMTYELETLSLAAKIAIGIGILAFVAGIVLILYVLTKKRKKQ